MNQYEMVVLIVAVAVLGAALKHAIGPLTEVWRDHLKHNNGHDDPEPTNGNTQEQLERLEARVRVLERIVTSDGYDLKQEFKKLDEEQ
ncbi:MAG: hypothetical protein ACWA5Q_10415 [bacterium]